MTRGMCIALTALIGMGCSAVSKTQHYDSPAQFYRAGMYWLSKGRPDTAIAVIDAGLTRFPNDPDLYTARATAKFKRGDRNGAASDLTTASKLSGKPEAFPPIPSSAELPPNRPLSVTNARKHGDRNSSRGGFAQHLCMNRGGILTGPECQAP